MAEVGFVDIRISEPYDTFGGAGRESNARAFEVYGYICGYICGYSFLAYKPG